MRLDLSTNKDATLVQTIQDSDSTWVSLDNYLRSIDNKYVRKIEETEIEKAIADYSARGAASLLMNVNSGEIISLVSLPDFDINRRTLVNDEKFLNKRLRY